MFSFRRESCLGVLYRVNYEICRKLIIVCSKSVLIGYIRFFLLALLPNAAYGLLILEVSRSHTTTHHSRQVSSGRVISPSQTPLPDKTQHSRQTDIQALGGIRTHNLSRRLAADLHLRPRGLWDRHTLRMMFSRIFSAIIRKGNARCAMFFLSPLGYIPQE